MKKPVSHFQGLADHAPDIIYRYLISPNRHVAYISPAVSDVLGYDPQEFYDNTDLFLNIVHPDDRAWMASFTPVDLQPGRRWSCRWLHKNGATVWLETYNLPIYDEDGKLIAVEGITRDITRQKLAEEQNKRANRALRMVLACAKAVTRSQDEADLLGAVCNIIVGNQYALAWAGYALDDAQKLIQIASSAGAERHYCQKLELTWDENLPSGRGPVARAIRERIPIVVQNIPDAPEFYTQVQAQEHGLKAIVALPVIHHEQLIGLLAVYSYRADAFDFAEVELLMELADELAFGVVSLRTREEARLMQAALIDTELLRVQLAHERELSELKTRFIAMASHEFRTPLTAILSSTDILKLYGGRMTEERQTEHFDGIRSAVEHMNDMLDDILLVENVEAGIARFTPNELDLEAVLADIVKDALLRSYTAHEIDFRISGNCANARMDRQLLRQIFSNLLSNAMKYSPGGESIHFHVRCEGGWAVCEVADQGIGIPEDEQARLFDTFYRARNVGTIPGTGLGLAIVKASVDLHGGVINFQSGNGAGTTFVIKLPLRPQGEIG